MIFKVIPDKEQQLVEEKDADNNKESTWYQINKET